jgi:hypothetical protein
MTRGFRSRAATSGRGDSHSRPFVVCVGGASWRYGSRPCNRAPAAIKSVDPPGGVIHVGVRGRALCFAVTSCAAQRLSPRHFTVVIGAVRYGRGDLTREGLAVRTAARNALANRERTPRGGVALLCTTTTTRCASKSPPSVT